MGFFGRVSNWLNTTGAKTYNAVRAGLSTGYHAVKQITGKIGGIADTVDNTLNAVKDIPVVGELATVLQSNPLYQEARSIIKTGQKVVDDAGKIGTVADRVITGSGILGPTVKPM